MPKSNEKAPLTPHGSYYVVEYNTWTMNYGPFGGVQKFPEYGVCIHVTAADAAFGADKIKQMLTAASALAGATWGGTGGTLVIPGVGTIAGGVLGGALGGFLGEMGSIILDVIKWLSTNDDGSYDIRAAPHALAAGTFVTDPNVPPIGLFWGGARKQLDDLNKTLRAKVRRASPAGSMSAMSTESEPPDFEDFAARGAKSVKGKLVKSTALSSALTLTQAEDDAPSVKTGKTAKAAPGAAATGGTPKAASDGGTSIANAAAASKGEMVEGKIAARKARYYKIDLDEGEEIKILVYTSLPEDSSAATASFAIQDEEGGNLDRTSLFINSTGEDFTKEEISFSSDEAKTYFFRIRSEDDDSPAIRYRIKIK